MQADEKGKCRCDGNSKPAEHEKHGHQAQRYRVPCLAFVNKLDRVGARFEEVVQEINEKLLRRHPHVFGGEEAENAEEVLHRWEQIKQNEKEDRKRHSILEGIPDVLPALLKAHRIQDRAARVGFDWEETSQVLEKVEEEITEFKSSLQEEDQENIEAEFGDLLFALVNLSRFIKVNPEDALRKTIRRFMSRFNYIEEYASANELELHTLSLEEMERLWIEAKGLEGK